MRAHTSFISALLLLAVVGCAHSGIGSSPLPSDVANHRGTSSRVVPNVSYSIVHAFQNGKDGANPLALAVWGGSLYGTTSGGGQTTSLCSDTCGTIFKLAPSGGGFAEHVIYSFKGAPDGRIPTGAVIIDAHGALYGVTGSGGGTSNSGTVFKLKPAGARYTESVLYRFQGPPDGTGPYGLPSWKGAFYGTTVRGGGITGACPDGCGIAYKLTPTASGYTETILHHFKGGSDGWQPHAALVQHGGVLYGTTFFGGRNTTACPQGCGTVFKLTPSGAHYVESVIYRFVGKADGYGPSELLWFGSTNPALYGTTQYGGVAGCSLPYCYGVVFELAPAGSKFAERVIYRFQGHPDGANPLAGLVAYRGSLYGTTQNGGSIYNTSGSVFRLTPSGSTFLNQTLYSFQNTATDGYNPQGKLLVNNGALYGTTAYGGGSANCSQTQCGTVFEITP